MPRIGSAASRHHPVIAEHRARRAADVQLRVADAITSFAGSMPFVYVHAVVFAFWMVFLEPDPWPTLTLVVSLEAIFLSAFVMIGQNRQAEFQHAKAEHDFVEEELELKTNTELTRAIHALTTDIHRKVNAERAPDGGPGSSCPSALPPTTAGDDGGGTPIHRRSTT